MSQVIASLQARPPGSLAGAVVLIGLLALLMVGSARAELRVAVAANFVDTLNTLVSAYAEAGGEKVTVIPGSTGKHYAQILHGAPFDLFFAADEQRPALLEQKGRIVPDSRFTYAVGKLVLWRPEPSGVASPLEQLRGGSFSRLAIANPRLAPYGRAAAEVLRRQQLWSTLHGRIVRGENVAQAYQFVSSGNAQLGFVALSQVLREGVASAGAYWLVPAEQYAPIRQQAVLLRDSAQGRAFLRFVRSEPARRMIRQHGYDLVDG